MTTYQQTVEVTFASALHRTFHSIEERPVAPEGLLDFVKLYNRPSGYFLNGDEYVWHPDGRLTVLTADGTRKVFWSKPTVGEAVAYGGSCKSCAPASCRQKGYWEFRPDGSVICSAYGGLYFFGVTRKVAESEIPHVPIQDQRNVEYNEYWDWWFVDDTPEEQDDYDSERYDYDSDGYYNGGRY